MWLFLNLLTVPSHNAMFTHVSKGGCLAFTPLTISNCENFIGCIDLLEPTSTFCTNHPQLNSSSMLISCLLVAFYHKYRSMHIIHNNNIGNGAFNEYLLYVSVQ